MSGAAAPHLASGLARALRTVTTPLLPADYLDLVAPLRSAAALRGRIEAICGPMPDAATLLIRPGRGWRGHVPGQYVRLGVDVDGVRLWRAYSVSSGPRADGRITVTVRVVPGGRVSSHLVHRVQPGTLIQLDQAAGQFHLPAAVPDRVLFVTAGSGITPVIGMLRHGLDRLDDVVVLHSDRDGRRVLFAEELRDMARSGRVRLVERHTAADGRLEMPDLDRLVPDWPVRSTWACGPAGLLDALEEHWRRAGIPDRLRTERFHAAARAAGDGEGGPVTFGRSAPVAADGATPLLDVAEAAGVLMPSGCRMGICYGCVVPLASGSVRDLRSGAVTTAAPGDGVKIQTCISAAAGPCALDL